MMLGTTNIKYIRAVSIHQVFKIQETLITVRCEFHLVLLQKQNSAVVIIFKSQVLFVDIDTGTVRSTKCMVSGFRHSKFYGNHTMHFLTYFQPTKCFFCWFLYKPEGHEFDSRWCNWNFLLT